MQGHVSNHGRIQGKTAHSVTSLPGKPVHVLVSLQGSVAGHEHVDAQVEFLAACRQWRHEEGQISPTSMQTAA